MVVPDSYTYRHTYNRVTIITHSNYLNPTNPFTYKPTAPQHKHNTTFNSSTQTFQTTATTTMMMMMMMMMVIPPITGNLKVSIQWCTMKLGNIHSTSCSAPTVTWGTTKKDPIQGNDYFAAFEEVPIQDTDEAGFSDLASITTCNEYLKLVNGSKIEGMQWIGCSCCHTVRGA